MKVNNKQKEYQRKYDDKMAKIGIRITPDGKKMVETWAADHGETVAGMIKRLLSDSYFI